MENESRSVRTWFAPFGKATFLAILATMAEWVSDKLSEYAKETRQRLIAKGRLPSVRPPYGYVYDKDASVLVKDKGKADVVRLIFSLYIERRLGLQVIRVELAARAIPSPSGNVTWIATQSAICSQTRLTLDAID